MYRSPWFAAVPRRGTIGPAGTLRSVPKPLHLARLSLVSAASLGIALACRYQFGSSWLEVAAFGTGVVGVYLAAVEHVANYPVGIVNVLLYAVFFFQGRLFGDAALQVVFFAFLMHGWISWTRRDADQNTLQVSRLEPKHWLLAGLAIGLGTAALFPLLATIEGKNPLVDGFTTSGSLVAQFLLNRKKIENWILWIVVNVVYIPWYFKLGYYPTGILYSLFLVLAVLGFASWRATLSTHEQLGGEGAHP